MSDQWVRVDLPINLNPIPSTKRREVMVRCGLKIKVDPAGTLLVNVDQIGRVRTWQTGAGTIVGVHTGTTRYYEIEFDEEGDFAGVCYMPDDPIKLASFYERGPRGLA